MNVVLNYDEQYVWRTPYFDGRWRVHWKATDKDSGKLINQNVASFGRDESKPPLQQEIDTAFAKIVVWVIAMYEEAEQRAIDEAAKEAYFEKWNLADEADLVKKLIDADYDPAKITKVEGL